MRAPGCRIFTERITQPGTAGEPPGHPSAGEASHESTGERRSASRLAAGAGAGGGGLLFSLVPVFSYTLLLIARIARYKADII